MAQCKKCEKREAASGKRLCSICSQVTKESLMSEKNRENQ